MKIETVTVHKIDAFELNDLVNETYTLEPEKFSYGSQPRYNFVAVEECGNDSAHEFHVDGYVAEWDEGELAKWIASGGKEGWIGNDVILDDLCRRGLIPEGDYVVSVCW